MHVGQERQQVVNPRLHDGTQQGLHADAQADTTAANNASTKPGAILEPHASRPACTAQHKEGRLVCEPAQQQQTERQPG